MSIADEKSMAKRQVLAVGAWRCGLGGKRHKRFELPANPTYGALLTLKGATNPEIAGEREVLAKAVAILRARLISWSRNRR